MSKKTEDPHTQFAKSIAMLTQKADGFTKAFEAFSELRGKVGVDLDTDLTEKKRTLAELETSITGTRKRRFIEVDNDVAKYQLDKAREYLREVGREDVPSDELARLKDELAAARADHAREIEEIRATAERAKKQAVAAVQRDRDLTHAAEVAQLKAESAQSAKEIAALKSEIDHWRSEVAATRDLAARVADSASNHSINVSAPESRR